MALQLLPTPAGVSDPDGGGLSGPTWRTKAGAGQPVEHRNREAAEAHIGELRERYRAGARFLRMVRVFPPEGGVRVIDFEREVKAAARALQDVERATAARDRAIQAATQQWEAVVARAVSIGQPVESVAEAAGISPREVRAIVRRQQ